MQLFFLENWVAFAGQFSLVLFPGMTEAWKFVAHGCDLDVNLKADKLNP